MGDVTTSTRRISCDGCDLVEEIPEPKGKRPGANWTTVSFGESGPPRMYAEGAAERPLEPKTYCQDCIERAIRKLDDLKAEAERLKGGKAPRGFP